MPAGKIEQGNDLGSYDLAALRADFAAFRDATSSQVDDIRRAFLALRNPPPQVAGSEWDAGAIAGAITNYEVYLALPGEADVHGCHVENLSNVSVTVVLGMSAQGRQIAIVKTNIFKRLAIPDGVKVIGFLTPSGGVGMVRVQVTSDIWLPMQGAAS